MEKEPTKKLISTWENVTKDNDGDAHIHTLHKYEYQDEFDQNNYLSQASPVKITSSRTKSIKRDGLLLADVPDIQYGFRRMPNGELVPTHCPEAMDVWLQIMKDAQPDTIILGGDELDLPELSRFDKDKKHFVDTMQLSIDGLHKYLSRLRADNPNARIINLDSNHVKRLGTFIMKNAMPLFGIKPANMPEEFAVNSYPYLLRLKELDIEWCSGYPASSYKINERLETVHGDMAIKGSSAQAYLGKYATSVMFHHTHRREYARKTYPNGHSVQAFSFGCQCDTKGAVPSYYSGIEEMGGTVNRFENWDSGGGFVEYNEGDRPFQVHAVPIEPQDNYEATYNGRVYKAREEVVKALREGK